MVFGLRFRGLGALQGFQSRLGFEVWISGCGGGLWSGVQGVGVCLSEAESMRDWKGARCISTTVQYTSRNSRYAPNLMCGCHFGWLSLGFGVCGVRVGVLGVEIRVQVVGVGFRSRVQGVGFRVQGSGCRVQRPYPLTLTPSTLEVCGRTYS